MKHVVAYNPYTCPKCMKINSGSAEAILDLLICPKCAEKYRKELMPQIEKLVRDYFQPERLNPEEARKLEDELMRKIIEDNPSYYNPNGDLPLVFDKNLRRLTHQEIMSLCDSLNSENK